MVCVVVTGIRSVVDETSGGETTGIEDGVSHLRQLLYEDPMPDHSDWSTVGIPTVELESMVGFV